MAKGKSPQATREVAEALAVQGLTFIAQDPARLASFLAASGLSPRSLRAAAAEPSFLAGVLEHILADESLLLEFAAAAGLNPAQVGGAHAALAGRAWERDVP